MAQNLKLLFATFRSKGIKFNHLNDFNGDGEYHAVLRKIWLQEMEKDETFASGIGTSTFDYEADKKIRDAYKDTDFDPLSNSDSPKAYDDRRRYLIFVLGRYFLIRGRKELTYLKWSQVNFCEATENKVPVKYVEIKIEWDKSNQLKLNNTTPRHMTDLPPRIYPNPNDPLCPYKFLLFFRSLCEPDQTRVFCKDLTPKQLRAMRLNKLPYLYNKRQPMGENSIDGNTKDFAKQMGFDNWQRCTNHGNRKLGITTAVTNAEKNISTVILKVARHKNITSQQPYQQTNVDMLHNYNTAIVGNHVEPPPTVTGSKHLASAPTSPEDRKIQRTSDAKNNDQLPKKRIRN
jgi:hypothetical protein